MIIVIILSFGWLVECLYDFDFQSANLWRQTYHRWQVVFIGLIQKRMKKWSETNKLRAEKVTDEDNAYETFSFVF